MADSRIVLDAVSADMHTWIEENDLESVSDGIAYILAFNGSFATRDSVGRTYLSHALSLNNPAMAQLFIDQLGKEPVVLFSYDNKKNSVCHLAAQSKVSCFLPLYLEKLDERYDIFIDRINLANADGETGLHVAMQNRAIEAIAILMNAGADWLVKDFKKQSSLMLFLSLPRDVQLRMFVLLASAIRKKFYTDLIQYVDENLPFRTQEKLDRISLLWGGVSLEAALQARLHIDRSACLATLSQVSTREQKLIGNFPGSNLRPTILSDQDANLELRPVYWRTNQDMMRLLELSEAIDALLATINVTELEYTTVVTQNINRRFVAAVVGNGLALLGSAGLISTAIASGLSDVSPSMQTILPFWLPMLAGIALSIMAIWVSLSKILTDQNFVANWRPVIITEETQVRPRSILNHEAWDRLVAQVEEVLCNDEVQQSQINHHVHLVRANIAALKTNQSGSAVHRFFKEIKVIAESRRVHVATTQTLLPSPPMNGGPQ